MNDKTKLVFFGGVLVVVLVFGTLLYNSLQSNAAPDAPQSQELVAAPDFTVTDNNGNEVKLSDFIGKPVVLNFWASWCGYCKDEMPYFENQFKEMGDDVAFLMVNSTDGRQETEKMARDYITSGGYTFPVYYDLELSASTAYNVTGLPITYFINKDGNIVTATQGRISEEKLISSIEKIKS